MGDEDPAPGTTVPVKGVIVLPPGGLPATAAMVTVRVEETSRADAPSTVVAEQQCVDVSLTSGGASVPFAVEVPADLVEPGGRYQVRVHVDVSGSGDVTDGDYVSTQSHPVLDATSDEDVHVPVRKV